MPEGTIRRRPIGNENSLPARANAATRRQMLIGTAGVFGCLTLARAEAGQAAREIFRPRARSSIRKLASRRSANESTRR